MLIFTVKFGSFCLMNFISEVQKFSCYMLKHLGKHFRPTFFLLLFSFFFFFFLFSPLESIVLFRMSFTTGHSLKPFVDRTVFRGFPCNLKCKSPEDLEATSRAGGLSPIQEEAFSKFFLSCLFCTY